MFHLSLSVLNDLGYIILVLKKLFFLFGVSALKIFWVNFNTYILHIHTESIQLHYRKITAQRAMNDKNIQNIKQSTKL